MSADAAVQPASDPLLRLGILGASRIAVESVVAPARDGGARLVAVAARDPARAEQFAAEHGVERVVAGYEALIADPEVEVVYNALPNSLHGPWNLAAIAAGKHVLTEKPFASNAAEARAVAAAAAAAGVVVLDGFHYRYHPIFVRLLEVITGGEIGPLRSLEVRMLMPAPADDDLRWSLPLAGGVMMDLGCYALHVMSTTAAALGGVPELVRAEAVEGAGRPGVDQRFHVDLTLPGGATGELLCDMAHPGFEFSITATGELGAAKINNFIKVSSDDRLIIHRHGEAERVEHLGTRSSYHHQLDALTAAVRHQTPYPTDAADAVVNLELIDACYELAGLAPRPAATTV
ncbi:MAG TPA: Gfo/Idh/MocA family oxidoreductase [Friedmanniella sp.]